MPDVTVRLPEGIFATLRRSPREVEQEMRLAAAIDWYRRGMVSQGSRAGFLELLSYAAQTVVVPAEVVAEIDAKGPGDPVAQAVGAARWLTTATCGPQILEAALRLVGE